jgi:hypothetical protein
MTTNKLTPRLETIKVSEALWISIDIGIWPGESGQHLTLMAYHQFTPGQWRPAVGRLDAWEATYAAMKRLWDKYICILCKGASGSPCPHCNSTGWKDWNRWMAKGGQLNTDNYPVL